MDVAGVQDGRVLMGDRRRNFAVATLFAGAFWLVQVAASHEAVARFVKSVNNLYVDVQKLSTSPTDKAKYFIYAIIRPGCRRCPKTYFIMSETGNVVRYMGAFRCDKSFEVLPQSSNGMKNILCRNWSDRVGAELARVLRFDAVHQTYK